MGLDHFVGTVKGCFEDRVGLAGLHRAEHVGHVDLKDYVHTALEVKAEAYAPFAYVVECVAEIHFLLAERVHVVLIGLVVEFVVIVARFLDGIGCRLVLILARYERE